MWPLLYLLHQLSGWPLRCHLNLKVWRILADLWTDDTLVKSGKISTRVRLQHLDWCIQHVYCNECELKGCVVLCGCAWLNMWAVLDLSGGVPCINVSEKWELQVQKENISQKYLFHPLSGVRAHTICLWLLTSLCAEISIPPPLRCIDTSPPLLHMYIYVPPTIYSQCTDINC